MIAVLGFKRVIILAVLLVVNIVLAAAVYMYFVPEVTLKKRELKGLSGQVSTLRGDIDRMQVEFDQLKVQKTEFEELQSDGFFKNQDRRVAEKVLNQIQKTSGVSNAIASIQAGVIEENEEAKKAGYKILKSPVEIRLEAVDDTNIFHYLFLIEHYFPGHIAVEEAKIERDADVSSIVLRSIASGGNPPLVKAEVEMVWRTMIPESKVIGEVQP